MKGMPHSGRASSQPCDPAIPERSHPTASAPPHPDPARCLSAMLVPIHHAWRLGYCNSPCEGSRSAPRKEQTGEGHGVYASAAYSQGLLKVNYTNYSNACFRPRKSELLLLLPLLTPLLLCYCLLLYRAALAPCPVSALMPRCRFGVAPYTRFRTHLNLKLSFLSLFSHAVKPTCSPGTVVLGQPADSVGPIFRYPPTHPGKFGIWTVQWRKGAQGPLHRRRQAGR